MTFVALSMLLWSEPVSHSNMCVKPEHASKHHIRADQVVKMGPPSSTECTQAVAGGKLVYGKWAFKCEIKFADGTYGYTAESCDKVAKKLK